MLVARNVVTGSCLELLGKRIRAATVRLFGCYYPLSSQMKQVLQPEPFNSPFKQCYVDEFGMQKRARH